MNNKPNLLITMGCSYTEGLGCWDTTIIPKGMNTDTVWNSEYIKYYEMNLHNFHKKGWPNKLCKKLGYDKVINLGLAGSSTSGQLKLFVEKYLDIDLSKYNVLIVWLLTEPSRFSFYRLRSVANILPTNSFNVDNQIGIEYLNFIKDMDTDPLLEQIFYLKLFTQLCENKGYNFIYTYWERYSGDNLMRYFNSKNSLYDDIHHLLPKWPYEEPYSSEICLHPNENGYELLANNIYEGIEKNHSHLIPNKKSETFEWVWDGEITHHKSISEIMYP